jgi:cytochrome c oxidase cbb3-type subunit 1
MINAPAPAASAEVTAIDTTARVPLLYLIGAGLLWLVISGALALVTSIQLHSPLFMADCSWLTHGRAVAARETAFIYGWGANAGIACALWVLARLGGAPLRGLNWLLCGSIFWNLSLAVGLVGIATGDMTTFSFLQIPAYVQPSMLVAYGAMSVTGVLAWSGRRTDGTFAAQWYAVAALFLFPWLLSAAHVVLIWSPLQGTVQAIAAGWFAQSAWTLWLAPLALTGAYYVIPKLSGRALGSYDFASLGLWTLIVVGGWSGGRHLIGGPVPAWIATMAVASCSLLLGHYLIVWLNLRGVTAARGTSARFISFGLMAYTLVGVLDAITAFRGIAVRTQFTLVTQAQQELALYGAVSMILFGVIYYMTPRLTGRAWLSANFISAHRWLATGGVLLVVLALAVGGWSQGGALLNAQKSFADIFADLKLPLLAATTGYTLLLAGNLIMLVNFCQSVCSSGSGAAAPTSFRQPLTMEVTAS